MTTLSTTLNERKEDFFVHLALADSLDQQLFGGETLAVGETVLSARHLLTIKSGLIIHLYNIVEAVMTRTIDEVGAAVRSEPPDSWANNTLKEWLRFHSSKGSSANEDSRLDIIYKAALKLLDKESMDELKFKKPSGTWSDRLIYTFSQRLSVEFNLPADMAQKIRPTMEYGEKSPMEFLADRRNAIAHGRRSFESGAEDLTLTQIRTLADTTIDYMQLAVDAFQKFLDERKYLAEAV